MNEEKEINLMDFLVYPLYHWKGILCSILVFLLLGNLFLSIRSNAKENEDSVASRYNDVQSYENQKMELESYGDFLHGKIKEEQHYLNNSVLLSVDPFHAWQAQYRLHISTDYQILPSMEYQNPDQTPMIVSAYESLLNDEAFTEKIAADLSLEPWQLRELIDICSDDNGDLSITVISESLERSQQIMDLIKKELPGIEENLHKTFGAFSANVILDSSSQTIASFISEAKDEILNTLHEDLDNLNNTIASIENLKDPTGSHTVKNSVLLIAIGIILSYGYYCIRLLTCGKLYSAPYLEAYKGLIHLGSILPDKKAGKFKSFLRKLEDRASSSGPEAYALAAANIRNLTDSKTTLLIAGDASSEICKAAAEKLQAQLPEKKLIYKGSLLRDAESVSALKGCDGVILVEQCMVSSYKHIEKELACIKCTDAPVVGCVVVDL